MKVVRHPAGLALHLVGISSNPLYSIVFYSNNNSTIYVYSINGQLLDFFCDKTGFIYAMKIIPSSNSTETLVRLLVNLDLSQWPKGAVCLGVTFLEVEEEGQVAERWQ